MHDTVNQLSIFSISTQYSVVLMLIPADYCLMSINFQFVILCSYYTSIILIDYYLLLSLFIKSVVIH